METHHKSWSPRDAWSPWQPCLPLVSPLSFNALVTSGPLWVYTHTLSVGAHKAIECQNKIHMKLTHPGLGTNETGTEETEEGV